MCSVDEEDLDTLPEAVGSEQLSHFCKKCGKDATIILRRKDVYCVSCFTVAVNHKFRANLGKNKTIRANQRVLLAVSGGLASSVLLKFVHSGICEDSHKKLRVIPVCIHIIEGVNDLESYTSRCEFLLGQCKQYGIPVYLVQLSSILDPHTAVPEPDTAPTCNEDLDNQLNVLINNVSGETSRKDLVVKLKRSLLVKCANQLKCDFILTGENSTSLASKMLANLALGRGAQIQDDIGFCDSRDIVKILKPIKDIANEELRYFADTQNLTYLPTCDAVSRDSIQSTIFKFVVDLQENFPATISTICKTGEKMGDSSKATRIAEDDCILCQSLLDTQETNSSALQATEFSRLVSSTGPHHFMAARGAAKAETSSEGCAGCSCNQRPVSRDDVDKLLCYGCRLIFRDIKDGDVPVYFKNAVKTRIAMTKLRSEINDFLI